MFVLKHIKNLLKIVNILLLGLLVLSCGSKSNNFQDFLKEIESLPASEQNKRLAEYIKKRKVLPAIEGQRAWFIAKDTSGGALFISGDMCSWKKDSLKMKRIGQSSYYDYSRNFPENARLEYKFVLNQKYIIDQNNPFKSSGPFGENSILFMPAYHFPQEILLSNNHILTNLDTLQFKSFLLKNERKVFFYHHSLAKSTSPLLVFQDGADYLNFGRANIILDNLIRQKRIPALNAIFVNPQKRMKEYWLNDAYLKMLFHELLPFVRKKYRLSVTAPLTLGGASLGGLASLYALKDYHRRLNFVFSQSGSFWVDHNALLNIMKETSGIRAKVYLDYGTFENTEAIQQSLANIFKEKKVKYKIKSWPEGHNWGNWRAHLAAALEFGLER